MWQTNAGLVNTISGKVLDIFNPLDQQIDIDDIAHALSLICRYCGHVNQFYSVAQHCVIVSQYVKPRYAIEALLHDATEAYMGDMISPIKKIIHAFSSIEDTLARAIYRRFGVRSSKTSHANIKKIDTKALITEMRDLTNRRPSYTSSEVLPLTVEPLPPNAAKQLYLQRFKELQGAR